MICVEGPVAYFDVDGTLVLWNKENDPKAIEFRDKDCTRMLVPHTGHIKKLKALVENEGYRIIVWSKRGGRWAKEVVEKLELEDWVDITADKPEKVFDDIAPCEWLPKRTYLEYHLGEEENNVTGS